jgi:hypothetical protein
MPSDWLVLSGLLRYNLVVMLLKNLFECFKSILMYTLFMISCLISFISTFYYIILFIQLITN